MIWREQYNEINTKNYINKKTMIKNGMVLGKSFFNRANTARSAAQQSGHP